MKHIALQHVVPVFTSWRICYLITAIPCLLMPGVASLVLMAISWGTILTLKYAMAH